MLNLPKTKSREKRDHIGQNFRESVQLDAEHD